MSLGTGSLYERISRSFDIENYAGTIATHVLLAAYKSGEKINSVSYIQLKFLPKIDIDLLVGFAESSRNWQKL